MLVYSLCLKCQVHGSLQVTPESNLHQELHCSLTSPRHVSTLSVSLRIAITNRTPVISADLTYLAQSNNYTGPTCTDPPPPLTAFKVSFATVAGMGRPLRADRSNNGPLPPRRLPNPAHHPSSPQDTQKSIQI